MAQSKRFADWHGAIRPQENWIRSLQEMDVQTSMILKQLLKEEQASTTMWETDIVTVWQFSAVVYVCDVLCVFPFLPSLCLCFVTGRSGPGSLGTEGSSSWKRSRAGACHTCSSSAAARCSWLQSAPASLLKQVAELQSTVDRWVRLISTATAFYFWKPLYRKVPSHRLCFGIFSLGVESGLLHGSRATAGDRSSLSSRFTPCTFALWGIREESSWEPHCWSLHIYCSL